MTTQNDLLDDEPIESIHKIDAAENGSFGVLIPSIILDRFSYYGFRSLIVMYVMMQFEFTDAQAYSKIGLFTTLIYLMSVPGGIIGDFLLKLKLSLIVGSIIAAVGAVLCVFPTLELFYVGCILVMVGSGIYRPNFTAYVARITGNDLRQLDQRYLILYIMINVGAFFGSLVLVYIAGLYGYHFGFILVAISWMISAILLVRDKGNKTGRVNLNSNIKSIYYPKANVLTLLIVVIPIITCVLFWLSYESFYGRFNELIVDLYYKMDSGSILRYLIMSIGTIIILPIGLVLFLIFRKKWIHPLQRMAIGILLMAFSWGVISFIPNSLGTGSASLLFIVISMLIGISELFVSVTMLTLLGSMVPRKILSTITGVYLLVISLGNAYGGKLIYYIDPNSDRNFLPWICVAVGVIIFILPYLMKKNTEEV
jgi:POT family proton-dependent oligopeptide transporter